MTVSPAEIFDLRWSHQEVILASVFCGLVFLLFIYTTLQYSRRQYIRMGKFARFAVLFSVLFVVLLCVAVIVIGTGLKQSDEKSCVVVMFNSEWGCLYMMLITQLTSSVLWQPAVLCLDLYFSSLCWWPFTIITDFIQQGISAVLARLTLLAQD